MKQYERRENMGKQKADYLLRSDHIFTSTVENPFAGYVAVSGQNILAVGTDDGSDWIDEQTEVLELGNQLVTPGFIDVHTFLRVMRFSILELICLA